MSDIAGSHTTLNRELQLGSAVMIGLGSIIGTGVFVSIGIASGIAGPAIILAMIIAAAVAACNALSSAQLAASHPVSGGTYEYGYRYLRPWLGFSAGWMFMCAKTASAATAALGFAGYLLSAPLLGVVEHRLALTGVAVATVVVLTLVVLGGIRRSSWVNIAIVSVTLAALGAFVLAGLPLAVGEGRAHLLDFTGTDAAERFWPAVLHASALMFVAYTGYGRIATMGEEVREPRRTIPRAIIITLVVSALLYVAVAVVAIAAVGAGGAGGLGQATEARAAPLEVASRAFGIAGLSHFVAIGAMTAMLGVLLNLILGLSRVLLAMGRRGDMPGATARLSAERKTPIIAILIVGAAIAALAVIGDVRITWTFSAFTVLIYYAVTNMAALALPREERLYSRWIAWIGLISCVSLAFFVEWQIWAAGLGLLCIGLAWRSSLRWKQRR